MSTELPLEEIAGLLAQLGLDVGTALVAASDPDHAVSSKFFESFLDLIIDFE